MEQTAEVFDQIVRKRRSYRVFDTTYSFPEDIVKRSLERATLAPNSSNMQLWEFYRIKSKDALNEVAKICLSQSGAVTASEIVVFVTRADLWKERRAAHLKRISEAKVQVTNDATRIFSGNEKVYFKRLMPFFYNTNFSFLKDILKFFVTNIQGLRKPFMRDVYSWHIPVVANKSTALAAQTFMLSIVAEGYECLPMEGLDSKRMKKFLKLPAGADINMAVAVGKGMEKGLRGTRFRVPDSEVIFEI
jgi:nitroreductase